MKLDHINIVTTHEKLNDIKNFYCDALGLEVGDRPTSPKKGFWLYSGESPLIHLQEATGEIESTSTGHIDHFAFRAIGLTRYIERLKTMNIDYSARFNESSKVTQVFFRDPLGIKIEIGFLGEKL